MVEHACISMLVVHLSISPVLLLIDCESLIACLNSGCYASVVLQRMDACCIVQNSLTSILKGLSRPGPLQLPLTPNGYTCKQVGKYETCQCMIVVNDEMVTAKFCSFLMVLQHMDARCIFAKFFDFNPERSVLPWAVEAATDTKRVHMQT